MDEIVSTGGDPREADPHHMIVQADLVVGEDRDRLRETGEDHPEAAVEDATETAGLPLAIVILVRASLATETPEIAENLEKEAFPKKKSRSPLPQIQKTSTCVPKTKPVALSDPFADESFDAFDSFGGGNLSRQRKDSDTRRKNRTNNDSDTRKIALSTNPLAGEFKPAERMRKPPTEEVANLSAPSLTLLCDPYPKKDTAQESEPKEIPITSDSSVDSTSSASRTTPKDVPNIELPNTFVTNDYDSGEDDYDPANCAFSDHESDDNPTNPLARALNAFKEAPTSNRSSSSSMVMSPVTPPTEDEGSGALKIDSGSVTDISPKPMSDSGSLKPQAVVPPQKPAPPPMQSLLTSQLSQPSSSLFAPLQMPSRQPPLMSPSGGITRSDSKAGLLSALQNSSSIENQPLLNIVQNLSEIKNQLNLNKSLHDMIAQQDKEDKKMKKSKKTSSGREVFKKRKDFQRAVVNCSKESIKPFYKSRKIDKDQYKKIMKECVSKIVHSSKSYTLDKAKVAHTIEKYVNKYSKKSRF
ncbi:Oidioi.mRNA.OKI2018_I69.chr2.g8028.t1.cds [Oikopleura dioica]|uniref:Oidioi.mRNA.OKI2018_I69.chr2.g8028.t1.cds n=1 Tax=Oikopleura dioica TaxID=34765 RepID=A0ABN7TEA7_OIKDI|nr:Oidioi.mRNA.OKI2018_I69.chr2.g8028.t1.cds [Oikopleura dioica]